MHKQTQQQQKFWRLLAPFLIVLALLTKSLVPAGYMPAAGTDGFVDIVICTGAGEKTVSLPLSSVPDASQKHADTKGCAYQFLATVITLLPASEFLLQQMPLSASASDFVNLHIPPRIVAQSFEARAPPAV